MFHAEKGDTDHIGASEKLPELLHIVAQYSPHDVFNADESELYKFCPPHTTIGRAWLSGRKQTRDRFMFMLYTNLHCTYRFLR